MTSCDVAAPDFRSWLPSIQVSRNAPTGLWSRHGLISWVVDLWYAPPRRRPRRPPVLWSVDACPFRRFPEFRLEICPFVRILGFRKFQGNLPLRERRARPPRRKSRFLLPARPCEARKFFEFPVRRDAILLKIGAPFSGGPAARTPGPTRVPEELQYMGIIARGAALFTRGYTNHR